MSAWKMATFGGGCFWGVEALFEKLDGVKDAVSGYMGGRVERPSYEAVCSGVTGHVEVVQVEYDESQVGYRELLDYFFRMHDPTTPNRQGVDIGNQYRSAIFYHDEEQKRQANEFVRYLDENRFFDSEIVTEISSASEFWKAEEYHQDYYQKKYRGGQGPICHFLNPKSFLKKS